MNSSSFRKTVRVPFSRSITTGGIVAILLVSGCAGSNEESGDTDSAASPQKEVKLFFTAGEQFKPVEHEVAGSGSTPLEATEALLEGPMKIKPAAAAADELETLIPAGTRVEKLDVNDSGEATVALSEEFLGDVPAKAKDRSRAEDEEVTGRLGQLTYTLTSFDKVKSVKVRSGGLAVQGSPRLSSGGLSPADVEQDRGDFSEPPKVPKVPNVRTVSGGVGPGATSLQQKLADLGYLPSSGVDGVAGYQTEQAVMAFQAWEGLVRDGDAGPQTRRALRTAKRPKPSARRPNRFMEVRIDRGVLLLVKDGRTKRAIHVSAGAPGTETPTGRYRVFRKELMSWSVPFSTYLPYASYFNNGIAFHEYPDVPPYPASHGCVRVPTPEAKRVYNFARMNTVVVVRS